MPNTILSTWVKNVNKQRAHSSTTGALLSPTRLNTLPTHTTGDVQLQVTHLNLHFFTTYLSTYKLTISHLLFDSYPYYPQPLLLEPLKKI